MITTERFEGALWAKTKEKFSVTIGGLGSIGSWTSLFLARTGRFYLFMVDNDTIELINLGGQFYKASQKDELKVHAVTSNIVDFCGDNADIYITTNVSKIQSVKKVSTICISGFDNMEARKNMFNKWKSSVDYWNKNKPEKSITPIFIDGRLNAEKIQVFYVTPDRISDYEKHLFEDESIPEEVCSYKYTTHFSSMIGSRITQGLLNHVANYVNNDDICDIPFLIEEEGPLFDITIKT